MANIRVDALTEVTAIADDDVVMVDGKQGARATTWASLKKMIKSQCGIDELNTKIKNISENELITSQALQGVEINKYSERTIAGLQNFDEVKMYIEIGDVVKQWLYFDRSVTEQALSGGGGNNYYSIVVFKCDLNTGVIGVKVRSTIGWSPGNSAIKQIRTVKRK